MKTDTEKIIQNNCEISTKFYKSKIILINMQLSIISLKNKLHLIIYINPARK